MKLALVGAIFLLASAQAQQQCYFGPGADNRGPSNLVPCDSNGQSACCLLGDTCLSGNTCYNYETGDLYQYGCTDITYKDSSCPYKCGFNSTLSPWTALEYCNDVTNVTNTWVCHAPESCGCVWNSTQDLLVLSPRGCKEMGSDARVALYAPSVLAPYVSLPSTYGGNTSYYSPITVAGVKTWVSTAIPGYTPSTVTQLTSYEDGPSSVVQIVPNLRPAPSTVAAPVSASATSTMSSASSTTSAALTATSSPSIAMASPTSHSSEGLSAGAKAGIGVGVTGGALLLASVAFAAYLWGNRQRKRNAEASARQVPPPAPGVAPDGSQTYSPPMQQGSLYPVSTPDKTPSWQLGWPRPYQPAPYLDTQQQYPYQVNGQAPFLNVAMPPPMDEVSYKESAVPPEPTELATGTEAHETEGTNDGALSPRRAEVPKTGGSDDGISLPASNNDGPGTTSPKVSTDGNNR